MTDKQKLIDNAIRRLKEAKELGTEDGHIAADNILCDLLTTLGYKEVVEVYDKVRKWYA